jgi:hypothetical protein
MIKPLPSLVDDPPEEDSPDLTDEEIERAIFTKDDKELARILTDTIKRNRNFALKDHELRRRGRHLYWRATLVANQEPNKVLVFSVDWLQGADHVVQRSLPTIPPDVD